MTQNTNEVDVLQGMNWKVSSGNLKVLSGMRHEQGKIWVPPKILFFLACWVFEGLQNLL